MARNPADATDVLRDRIRTSESIADGDTEALIDFSDQLFLLAADYSDHRHEKLLRHCTRMAEEVGGLADALDERSAAEDIVRWINRTYDNEETNRDYRVALRVFGKRVAPETTHGSEHPPDTIAWVSAQTSRNYDPGVRPGDILHWDDHIQPLIEACENVRDAAMIAVAWDAGARSGEFRELAIGDVTDHPNGLQVTLDGKTGQRTVTLIPSVPYLNRWLSAHSCADDPDAPLWPRKSDNAIGLSYNGFKRAFEAAADRAGIERPVTLTNFRKSSASFLASQGLPQAHIEDHHGWTRGSSVAARYVAVFSEDADRALAAAHGLDVSESEPDPTGPLECPRCSQQTPREKSTCVCGADKLSRPKVRRSSPNRTVRWFRRRRVRRASGPKPSPSSVRSSKSIRSSARRLATDGFDVPVCSSSIAGLRFDEDISRQLGRAVVAVGDRLKHVAVFVDDVGHALAFDGLAHRRSPTFSRSHSSSGRVG
jgi:integrase